MNQLSIQTSLFHRQVLDVCCGSKMFWFNKSDPRAIFLDSRKESHSLSDSGSKTGFRHLEINPDIIGDFKSLPFPDKSFALVVFDPPHLEKVGVSSWLCRKYGKLNDDWRQSIAAGFAECFRVLKDEGVLIFKWNETDIPLSEVLCLTSRQPLFGNQNGRQSKTHWVVFANI